MIGQPLQDGKCLLLASISILAAWSYAGWTAIRAGTFADEFKGAGDQIIVQFKEFLAEADPRRNKIIQNDSRPTKGLIFDRFDMRTQIASVAHQK